MKSPLIRFIAMLAWLITSLAAINVGFMPFGYNFFQSEMVQSKMAFLITPAYYIIGVAGVISLIMFFMATGSSCTCMCHEK